MDVFVVSGGHRLAGRVQISGAKNSALKLVAAALLAAGRSVVRNVPDIADMRAMADVLRHLGAGVGQPERGTYVLDVPADVGSATPPELGRRLRASIVVLGPLLARNGAVRVALPGGCNLGSRNIDMHLSGLARMGAQITYGPDFVQAVAQRLEGADIELPFASVGATENLMLAAVTARGRTRIINAAREPEIADLAAFLQSMGADIQGAGTPELVISGVAALAPTEHDVVGDRIEAGTFAVAAVVTGGDLELRGVRAGHLRLALDKLRGMGAEVQDQPDGVRVRGAASLRATDIVTLPYPGFPTDLLPQFMLAASQASGTSMLTENVFDSRFSIVHELSRLGAEIEVESHHAIIRGPRALHGTAVRATDLRAGAALVVAGLVAEGETVVMDPHHVDRGYADLAGRLRAVGADVRRAWVDAPVDHRAGAA